MKGITINEGLTAYEAMSSAGRAARLRRCGIEAGLPSGGEGRSGGAGDAESSGKPGGTAVRRRYTVSVYQLLAVEFKTAFAGGGETVMEDGMLPLLADGGLSGEMPDTLMRQDGEERAIGLPPGGAAEEALAGRLAAYAQHARRRRGLLRRLERLAVSALYALGLDSGTVRLVAGPEGAPAVEAVTPLRYGPGGALPPGPWAGAAARLGAALALERPGRPALRMGMDPEFLILRGEGRGVVPASRFLALDGVAGCDAGPAGTRGAFPVAELRPRPSATPLGLLAQLMSAARAADRLMPDRSLRWRAGGMPLPGWALGGHVHFSGVVLTSPLLQALDNYLALPLALLEDPRGSGRRPRYGALGDFRHQPHGGFEYRTLPSFLVSPPVAKAAVHLAYLIARYYERLTLRPLGREELHAAYYAGDKTVLRRALPPLLSGLRRLPDYGEHARYIEPLFRHMAEGKTWDESRDIRGLWTRSGTGHAVSGGSVTAGTLPD